MPILDLILQSGPPDTSSGLIFGYAASALIFFGYVATIIFRAQSAKNNLELMEDLTNDTAN